MAGEKVQDRSEATGGLSWKLRANWSRRSPTRMSVP
jgi:hypothetical protein